MEAVERGFAEAIMLNGEGTVAEGSGENLFIVKGGAVVTTSEESGALRGITQDSVKTIARDLGYGVEERRITVEELKGADEVFFTGTAAEVTPIRQIDNKVYGDIGPVTRKIQAKYFEAVRGGDARYLGWLTYV